jgi:hypothetical protein
MKGNLAVCLGFGPWIFAAAWWILAGKLLFNKRQKEFSGTLEDEGFVQNYTFYGAGAVLMIDLVHNNIAVIFRWNPFNTYKCSAKNIEKAWVDDGKWGVGIMEGTSRVRFFLILNGIKIGVHTFSSNSRWRMDSKQVQTGISKAEKVVEALKAAKIGAENGVA